MEPRSGPSSWEWSLASWAHWWWWRSLNDDDLWRWGDDLDRLGHDDWGRDLESVQFGLSLSLDVSEPVVLHDQESDLGHRFSQDVSSIDVDGVIVDRLSGHVDDLVLVDLSDDLLRNVLDLWWSFDDSSVASEVESVTDDVGSVTSGAVLIEVHSTDWIEGSAEGALVECLGIGSWVSGKSSWWWWRESHRVWIVLASTSDHLDIQFLTPDLDIQLSFWILRLQLTSNQSSS